MTAKKTLQLALGICVAMIFLWLSIRDTDLRQMRQSLASASLGWFMLAFVAVILGYSCRVQRWRLMLSDANPSLTWRDCAGPFLASFAANNVLPFRVGDVMRAFAFNARLGTTSGIVLATVVVERMLDLLIILAGFGAALAAFDVSSSRLVGVGGIFLIGIGAVISLALLQPRVLGSMLRMVAHCAGEVVPRHGRAISEEMARGAATFKHLAAGGRLGVLVLWSAVAWFLEGCAFWFAALAFTSLVAPRGGWLALPVSAFATLIPSTPGYVGTFDYFTVLAMKTVGNDATGAALYAFCIHIVVWLPSTVAGATYLLLRSDGFKNHGHGR
ncbi:MAG: lysylphosphatidylglycerol synthase transmembrane domain-containing protein [Pseudomonadota bacterium]|nr:lysylphosphatidylglycerol synthase transmembrane domain-containing protein [Pseudomonadota bacterium]